MTVEMPEGYNEGKWEKALEIAEERNISDKNEIIKIYKNLDGMEAKACDLEEEAEIKGYHIDTFRRAKKIAEEDNLSHNFNYVEKIYNTLMNKTEIKSFNFYEVETKSGKEYYVEGYISTDDIDLVNDIVTKECMKDMVTQIKSGNIKLDSDHDTIKEENLNKIPIGRIVDAKLDNKGIWVKAMINRNHFNFKSIWADIQDRMIDAFSIAFQPIKKTTKYIQGKAIRLLEKVKLVNVALTGTPVNPQAKFTSIFAKSMAFYENLEQKGIEKKSITTQDLINLFKTFTDLLEKSQEINQNELLGYSQTNEFTDEMKRMAETGTEGKSQETEIENKSQEITSHSTEPLSGELKKMEEDTKTKLDETSIPEASEQTEDTKQETVQPEVKAEDSKESDDKEEKKSESEDEEDEEEKKLAEKKSQLETEIKSLEEKKLNLEKELVKPEFKALAQSSPDSIKLNNIKNRVNPLTLFA